MKILITAIGKAKDSFFSKIYKDYIKRIPWQVELVEHDPKKKSTNPEQQKSYESSLLLDSIPNNYYVIALDEKGKQFSSVKFANKIEDIQNQGVSSIAFLIGGADGHDKALLERADLVLSFSDMTWPHQFVRVMLAEQIYRAYTILSNHPYHRE